MEKRGVRLLVKKTISIADMAIMGMPEEVVVIMGMADDVVDIMDMADDAVDIMGMADDAVDIMDMADIVAALDEAVEDMSIISRFRRRMW